MRLPYKVQRYRWNSLHLCIGHAKPCPPEFRYLPLRKGYTSMRRTLLLVAKAATSILLLYLSLRWVDVRSLTERLSRLDPNWMAFALFLMMIQVAVLAARWREIAAACGANLSLTSAVQISFIAAFFNQVLPSTIGGDGVRIWLLARRGAGWAKAAYSVLIDRIVGVFALAIIVVACLPWTFELIHDPIARALLLFVGFGVVVATFLFTLIGTRYRQFFARWMLTRHLSAASRAAVTLCSSVRLISIVVGCSLVIHLLTIIAAWCCIRAIAAPVSFIQLLFLMPPVLLVATIPISIAGWGVRESSMIVAFAYAGLAESNGLTLSILFGAASFAVGVVGGIVWVISGLRVRSLVRAVAKADAFAEKS
ncbi:MAG TPA: lysylphosphatidylglycerol synthase transmembrane domain-containing protein [Pseudolabrys sp.]|nr:lysylphosphatidylglycerol synthase transmembrane domain-containing protein [Pseudolabrys sp.]